MSDSIPPTLPQGPVLTYATPIGFAAPLEGPWRDGNKLVTTTVMVLPDRCVKCNAPAEGFKLKKTYYWQHQAFLLLLLVNVIIMAIVCLIVRKSAKLEVGLCPLHRRKRSTAIAITWAIGLTSVVLLISAIVAMNSGRSYEPIGAVLLVLFFVSLIALLVYGIIFTRVLTPTKIDKQYGWFKGASPDYLDMLSSIR